MRAKVVVQDGLDHIEEAVLPCMTYKALCRSYVARSAVAHEVAHGATPLQRHRLHEELAHIGGGEGSESTFTAA